MTIFNNTIGKTKIKYLTTMMFRLNKLRKCNFVLAALLFCGVLSASGSAFAQGNAASQDKSMDGSTYFVEQERELNKKLQAALSEGLKADRIEANNKFVPQLVEVLKKPNSFEHPFDSLENVSVLYAPDRAFRIFTWVLPMADSLQHIKNSFKTEHFGYRYMGAIQLNNSEELELFPLIDLSNEVFSPEEVVLTNDYWFGAAYYNITMNEHDGIKYYTLFGWDGNNNLTSTIKVLDVLTFVDGKPVFGAPIFEFKRDGFVLKRNRMLLEFKKGSGVTMNYNPEQELIVYDYIEPETPEAKGNYYLYIPDGTYEGLKFVDGIWEYQDRVYTQTSDKPMQLSNDKPDGNTNASSTNGSYQSNMPLIDSQDTKKKRKKKKKRGFFKK